MARRIQVVIDDDLSGGTADETVTFGLDGITYEIDLNARNADNLRSTLQPYLEAGRKVVPAKRGTGSARAKSGAASSSGRAGEIRAWAQANGVAVSARGRVSADVEAKYDAAHA